MTTAAELQVWRLIRDQQRAATTRVRLVTTQASDLRFDFRVVGSIVNVRHRMPEHRVSHATLQRQPNHFGEIIGRQLHFSIKDQRQMILRIDRRLGFWTMTFHTKSIPFGAQQLRMIASVGIMAGRASLLERGLVQHFLAVEFSLIRVASETDIDGVRL